MNLGKIIGLPVGLALVALLASGGCNDQKQRIFQLESQCNDLVNRNKDLEEQVTLADLRADELGLQLGRKDIVIDEKDAEIARLKGQAGERPASEPAEGWKKTPLGDMVTVGSDILFSSGRATLTRSGMSRLAQIASDIRRQYAGLRVRVYGHTDSDPIKRTRRLWHDNLDLSANRAMAVARYLVSKGISAKTIESVAMGQHHPVAANRGSGKAKNRRVEIIVVKNQ